MPKRAAPSPQSLGILNVVSDPGKVEVLPGYKGPLKAKDLPYALPPRVWAPKPKRAAKAKAATEADLIQVDARSYTVEQDWSGLRFIFKVDRLAIQEGATTFNLFTTHIGRTVGGVAHWTEVGLIRAVQDTRYRLFTYDSEVDENDRWGFFGTMREGEVFALQQNRPTHQIDLHQPAAPNPR